MKWSSAVLMAVVALTSAATADVPQMINYQGRLTDGSGEPLDTTVSMEFAIYDDSVGGTPRWAEVHPAVTVEDGLFSVILGTFVDIDDVVFVGPDWLGITVGGDPELSPRTHLVSVGYAQRVSTVDGASGGVISGGVTIDGSTEDVIFDMSQSGDSSVLLPDDAVSQEEILDEPGIASAVKSGSTVLSSTVTYTDIETVEITIPTDGYIVLMGQTMLQLSGTTGQNGGYFQIDEDAGGGHSIPHDVTSFMDSFPSTGVYVNPIFVQRVYYKTQGTYTFRLEGLKIGETGTAIVYFGILTATFYPKSYGSVETVVTGSETTQFDNAVPLTTEGTERGIRHSEQLYEVDLREMELKAARLREELRQAERELEEAHLRE